MFLLFIYFKIFFLCLMSISDCYRTFYFPPMCNFSRETTDCSFQFQSALGNSCEVYNTNDLSACKRYSFSSWNLADPSILLSEADSDFSVTIVPYAAYVYDLHKNNNIFVSAINISLTTNSKDINGFSIVMTEEFHKRNVCRIFDFRKSAASIEVPHVFFYDCFHQLVEGDWENVSMTFKAYPQNTELNYFVYIPSLPETTSACKWKPLVMIFQGSLAKNKVHFKFSNAPEKLNVTIFNVMLVDLQGVQVQQTRLFRKTSQMMSSEFLDVATGYYSLHISIPSAENSCTVSETRYFFVGGKAKDYSIALLIALFLLLFISASLLIYFSGQWYIKIASPKSKPTLLFVYCYKSLLHDFLISYSKHLENHYEVRANMIYDRSGNPLTYLREKVAQSDIIVFVLSQHLNMLDKDSIDKGDHHWVNQLPEAISFVEDADVGSKRMCNVHFAKSRAKDGTKCIKHKGRLFMLPRDMDSFLCFVFKCSCTLYVLSKLFRKDHHKVSKLSNVLEEDEEMKRKLKVLLDADKGECPLSKTQSESYSFVESERVERIISDPPCKIHKPPESDKLLKESGEENLVSEEKEGNSDDIRNDPMKYYVRKFFRS